MDNLSKLNAILHAEWLEKKIAEFEWTTPPDKVDDNYVDTQGTLPLRMLYGRALCHPKSRWSVFGGIRCDDHWIGIPRFLCDVTLDALQGDSAETATYVPDKAEHAVQLNWCIGEKLMCPATHLISAEVFNPYLANGLMWMQLQLTAIFPKAILIGAEFLNWLAQQEYPIDNFFNSR